MNEYSSTLKFLWSLYLTLKLGCPDEVHWPDYSKHMSAYSLYNPYK